MYVFISKYTIVLYPDEQISLKLYCVARTEVEAWTYYVLQDPSVYRHPTLLKLFLLAKLISDIIMAKRMVIYRDFVKLTLTNGNLQMRDFFVGRDTS